VNVHNAVNKSLDKPIISEKESIMFYARIGTRGTSPVINQADLDETDMRSMVKGGLIGGGVVFFAGALLWWTTKGEKIL
jgi:hypothetical protein